MTTFLSTAITRGAIFKRLFVSEKTGSITVLNGRTLLFLALCLFCSNGLAGESPAPSGQEVPKAWIMPTPWVGNGQSLRDMINRGDEWKETRKHIAGVGYWPYLLNQFHSDEEIREFFAKLREWDLGFGFEVVVVKGPGWIHLEDPKSTLDAKSAFAMFQKFAPRFQSLGMNRVDWISMESSFIAARTGIPIAQIPDARPIELFGTVKNDPDAARQLAYGVEETVSYMAMMRKAYPGTKLGLIEPHPALSLDELKTAVLGIQKGCAELGIKGLEFFRLDLDWARLERENRPWGDVKTIEDMFEENGIPFSVIFWASDWPHKNQAGTDTPATWREGVLHCAKKYREAGGTPAEIIIADWNWTTAPSVPDSDPDTFTGSSLEYFKAFPPASWREKP